MLKQMETGQWAIIFDADIALTDLLFFKESMINLMICAEETKESIHLNFRPALIILHSMLCLPDDAGIWAEEFKKISSQ